MIYVTIAAVALAVGLWTGRWLGRKEGPDFPSQHGKSRNSHNWEYTAHAWEGNFLMLKARADELAASIEAELDKDYRGNPPNLPLRQQAAVAAYRNQKNPYDLQR